MKTIKLDKNNNVVLDKYGNIETLENIEALAQDVRTSLSMCYGENPFNTQQGIDYDNDFLGVNSDNQDYLKSLIRTRLLENTEVLAIKKVDINKQNETLKIQTHLKTIYGDANV